jgi:hypothetical protein
MKYTKYYSLIHVNSFSIIWAIFGNDTRRVIKEILMKRQDIPLQTSPLISFQPSERQMKDYWDTINITPKDIKVLFLVIQSNYKSNCK